MPASQQDKLRLTCPHCGNQQQELRTAYSTVCRKCGQHLRVQEVLNPARKAPDPAPAQPKRKITCFDCGTALEVSPSAESTMCKRCGRYVDLKDYQITSAISKNFKTKGSFVVEPKGYVLNTEATVGDAVIKGRFLGKLVAERSLTVYSSAEIKGTFTTGRLIIPPANHFRWKEPIQVASGEIGGELVGNLRADDTLAVKATGRVFGDITAANVVIEEGAVVVGTMRIGRTLLL